MDRLIKKVIRHIWGNCYKWRKYSLSLIDNNIKSVQSPAFFQTKSFLNNTCSRIILMYTGIFLGCVVGKKINLAIMLERILGTVEAVSRNVQPFCLFRCCVNFTPRSEEHTSELQSLMRLSYAVFCLKKK